jgi:hypothetical protein
LFVKVNYVNYMPRETVANFEVVMAMTVIVTVFWDVSL